MQNHAKPCRDSSSPRQRAHLANRTKEDQPKLPPPPAAQQGRPLQARQQNSKQREEKRQQINSQHGEKSDPAHGNGTLRRTKSEICGIEKEEKCFCSQIIICSSPPRLYKQEYQGRHASFCHLHYFHPDSAPEWHYLRKTCVLLYAASS
ncbi:hypothetical protein NC653_033973 [Populus alba x Populus x berolinensis]|uniref:Uncharacterized protein n=1 Tax=Populus alba x Populus x berolinensis TaxID=444605 RepID=A0AAD6PZT7_9ROSI|nr:hypothetical protein NC653_033973 [Populus alba x Populus x berolinensis]